MALIDWRSLVAELESLEGELEDLLKKRKEHADRLSAVNSEIEKVDHAVKNLRAYLQARARLAGGCLELEGAIAAVEKGSAIPF